MYTFPNGHFPESTFAQTDTCPNVHLPEWTTLTRMHTFPNVHLPEWTFTRMDSCSNGHLPEWAFTRIALSRMDTCPNEHLPEWTLWTITRMNTCPNGLFSERTLSRMDTCHKFYAILYSCLKRSSLLGALKIPILLIKAVLFLSRSYESPIALTIKQKTFAPKYNLF